IGDVHLRDFGALARADVAQIEAELQRLAERQARFHDAQIRILEARVAEPETEGKARNLVEIRVVFAVLAAHLAVKSGLLSDVFGERDGELARRVEISKQQLRKGEATLHARVEALDYRGRALARC